MQGFEDDFDDELEDGVDDPESMSLSGVAGGGMLPVDDDFVIGGGDDAKRVTQQSILIGVIVTVVAFGAILGMRVFQTDMTAVGASDETRKWMATLDSRLSNLGKMKASDPLHPDRVHSVFRDTDALIKLITDDQTLMQVPVTQVQMNPFRPVEGEVAESEDPAALAEAARQKQLTAAYDALDRIEVQSILGGATPRAFIGGEIYKAGDEVSGFRIKAINQRHIVLEIDGIEPRLGERPLRVSIRTDR